MIGKAGVGQGRDRMSCSQGALKGSHQWLGLTSLSPVARVQLLEHCRQQMALDVGRPLRRLPQSKVEAELGARREYTGSVTIFTGPMYAGKMTQLLTMLQSR